MDISAGGSSAEDLISPGSADEVYASAMVRSDELRNALPTLRDEPQRPAVRFRVWSFRTWPERKLWEERQRSDLSADEKAWFDAFPPPEACSMPSGDVLIPTVYAPTRLKCQAKVAREGVELDDARTTIRILVSWCASGAQACLVDAYEIEIYASELLQKKRVTRHKDFEADSKLFDTEVDIPNSSSLPYGKPVTCKLRACTIRAGLSRWVPVPLMLPRLDAPSKPCGAVLSSQTLSSTPVPRSATSCFITWLAPRTQKCLLVGYTVMVWEYTDMAEAAEGTHKRVEDLLDTSHLIKGPTMVRCDLRVADGGIRMSLRPMDGRAYRFRYQTELGGSRTDEGKQFHSTEPSEADVRAGRPKLPARTWQDALSREAARAAKVKFAGGGLVHIFVVLGEQVSDV